MTRRHTPNRSELALLRGKGTPTSLQAWTDAFGDGDPARADRYHQALVRFIGGGQPGGREWQSYIGHLSPNTRKAYAFAITEFFEWIARKYGRPVPPHAVRRQDTFDYVNFLANRPFTLEREKLTDGDHELRLALYDAVVARGGRDVPQLDIMAALPAGTLPKPDDLEAQDKQQRQVAHELGRMVLHDVLARSPTMEQLRAEHPQAGITMFEIDAGPDGSFVHLRDVFRYSLPPARGAKRTTISARVSALSSFWDVLSEGENVPGGEPILQHNIWKEAKRRVSKNLTTERKQAAVDQRVPPEVIAKLLMASQIEGGLLYMRDRALLMFLALTGARVSEAIQLRREPPILPEQNWPGWFMPNHDPPSIEVTRKGGKKMRLPYPPLALRALTEFQTALELNAAPPSAQWDNPGTENYIPRDDPQWRWRDLTRYDAPLFPPLYFWGANSSRSYQPLKPNPELSYGGTEYTRSMTRQAVLAMLKRMGEHAQLEPDEIKKLHPHAIRHFAATAMVRGGKDLRETQAILGHSSITTTEGYLEEVKGTVELSGQAAILAYLQRLTGEVTTAHEAPPTPSQAPERPAARPVRTIEATGIEITPEPSPVEEAAFIQASEPAYDLAEEVGPEAVPTHMLPAAPPFQEAAVSVIETAEGAVVVSPGDKIIAVEGAKDLSDDPGIVSEIRKNVSPGSPDWVYEAMNAGRGMEPLAMTTKTKRKDSEGNTILIEDVRKQGTGTREVVAVEFVQSTPFLRRNYDPWPVGFGLGTSSLLVWQARGTATRDGFISTSDPITGKAVKIPPFPVLAPEQVFPEASKEGLLDHLESLYNDWVFGDPEKGIAPSPTRTFGLVRWYWVFAYHTAKLQAYFQKMSQQNPLSVKPPIWVPFEGEATLGKNVRAHKTEWLVAWFRENAHTFIATVSAFNDMPRPERKELDFEEFMRPYEESLAAGASVLTSELPAWFADDDPIRALHDASPEEFDRFAVWIANVTGQRLTRERKENRKQGKAFAKEDWATKRERARDLLEGYFRLVIGRLQAVNAILAQGTSTALSAENEDLLSLSRSELRDEITLLKQQRDQYQSTFSEHGILLETEDEDPRNIDERIRSIIARSFPSSGEPGEVDANMFRGSALFSPAAFRLDFSRHTISHTKEFREEFAMRYDGRDSELVMRRTARALWERAKAFGTTEKVERGQYQFMYATMLAYLSWIVPAPSTMEREMPAVGRGKSADARRAWIQQHARLLREWAGWKEADGDDAQQDIALYMKEHGVGRVDAERAVGVAALMREFKLTEKEAEARFDAFDVLSVQNHQVDIWKSDDNMRAQLGSSIGPDGHMRIMADPIAAEAARTKRRRIVSGDLPVRVDVPALKPNARACVYEFEPGEPVPGHWYEVKRGAGPIRRYSPNAMARRNRLLANAMRVLPSPFRMAAAALAR